MTVTHAQPENPHALETLFELATDHAHFFTLTDNDQDHYMAMMAGWVFLGRREKSNMEKGVAVYCYLQVTLDVHDLTKHTNNTDAVAIFPINDEVLIDLQRKVAVLDMTNVYSRWIIGVFSKSFKASVNFIEIFVALCNTPFLLGIVPDFQQVVIRFL